MDSRTIHQTFDLLPDEMMLKIIKMATREDCNCICHPTRTPSVGIHGTLSSQGWKCSHIKYDHESIIDVFSKISARFKRISADKSLWKVLKINLMNSKGECETKKIRKITAEYLVEGTEGVWIQAGYPMYTTEIKNSIDNIIDTLSEKSPNLKALRLEYFCPIFAIRYLDEDDKLFQICHKFKFYCGQLMYDFNAFPHSRIVVKGSIIVLDNGKVLKTGNIFATMID